MNRSSRAGCELLTERQADVITEAAAIGRASYPVASDGPVWVVRGRFGIGAQLGPFETREDAVRAWEGVLERIHEYRCGLSPNPDMKIAA